jgi:hypothetical protein
MADDRLVRAAGLLDQRVCLATGGTWRDAGQPYGCVVSDAPPHDDGYGGRLVGESMYRGDRGYVVTMQPAVGQALADLLAYAGGDTERTGRMWPLLDALANALLHASADPPAGDPHTHTEEARRG